MIRLNHFKILVFLFLFVPSVSFAISLQSGSAAKSASLNEKINKIKRYYSQMPQSDRRMNLVISEFDSVLAQIDELINETAPYNEVYETLFRFVYNRISREIDHLQTYDIFSADNASYEKDTMIKILEKVQDLVKQGLPDAGELEVLNENYLKKERELVQLEEKLRKTSSISDFDLLTRKYEELTKKSKELSAENLSLDAKLDSKRKELQAAEKRLSELSNIVEALNKSYSSGEYRVKNEIDGLALIQESDAFRAEIAQYIRSYLGQQLNAEISIQNEEWKSLPLKIEISANILDVTKPEKESSWFSKKAEVIHLSVQIIGTSSIPWSTKTITSIVDLTVTKKSKDDAMIQVGKPENAEQMDNSQFKFFFSDLMEKASGLAMESKARTLPSILNELLNQGVSENQIKTAMFSLNEPLKPCEIPLIPEDSLQKHLVKK